MAPMAKALCRPGEMDEGDEVKPAPTYGPTGIEEEGDGQLGRALMVSALS